MKCARPARHRGSARVAVALFVCGPLVFWGYPLSVGAQADPTVSESEVLPWSPTPMVSIVTPIPLPITSPQIVVEAGVLPGGFLGALDRLAELLDRTVFSFGLPSLRARVALTQAVERVAELQALERNGELTPSTLHALLVSHARLIDIGDRAVARQISDGRQASALLLLLVRTRLAAAQVLQDVSEQLSLEAQLRADPTPSLEGTASAPPPSLEPRENQDESGEPSELDDAIASLVDLEGDLLPLGEASVPPGVLHVLAEQKLALAERDLLAAVFTVEERLAHGRLVIADVELRAVAESLLVTGRELAAAGNDREALSLATAVRGVVTRLASETITVAPEQVRTQGDARIVTEILEALVADGVLGLPERATAELRARQAAEQLRRDAGQ